VFGYAFKGLFIEIFRFPLTPSQIDPEGDYIRIAALERRDFPELLVDHKKQQARSKALYAGFRWWIRA